MAHENQIKLLSNKKTMAQKGGAIYDTLEKWLDRREIHPSPFFANRFLTVPNTTGSGSGTHALLSASNGLEDWEIANVGSNASPKNTSSVVGGIAAAQVSALNSPSTVYRSDGRGGIMNLVELRDQQTNDPIKYQDLNNASLHGKHVYGLIQTDSTSDAIVGSSGSENLQMTFVVFDDDASTPRPSTTIDAITDSGKDFGSGTNKILIDTGTNNHGLEEGESITLTSSDYTDGVYKVISVESDSTFIIDLDYGVDSSGSYFRTDYPEDIVNVSLEAGAILEFRVNQVYSLRYMPDMFSVPTPENLDVLNFNERLRISRSYFVTQSFIDPAPTGLNIQDGTAKVEGGSSTWTTNAGSGSTSMRPIAGNLPIDDINFIISSTGSDFEGDGNVVISRNGEVLVNNVEVLRQNSTVLTFQNVSNSGDPSSVTHHDLVEGEIIKVTLAL